MPTWLIELTNLRDKIFRPASLVQGSRRRRRRNDVTTCKVSVSDNDREANTHTKSFEHWDVPVLEDMARGGEVAHGSRQMRTILSAREIPLPDVRWNDQRGAQIPSGKQI